MRFCGRDFSVVEMENIRTLIAEHPEWNRQKISQQACEMLDWRKPDQGLKDMSCRVALLRMHRLSRPQLSLVSNAQDSRLWNQHVERYHYLGYQRLPGAQLRYFATIDGQIVAALGFGAAAWKTAPRDQYIGWNPQQREANLHAIVNHARYLILPWIHGPNLASHLLARIARELPDHWYNRYRIRPVLLETFVDHRLDGTCCHAANWIHVGETRGRGTCSTSNKPTLPIKQIWLYPLQSNFRNILMKQ